MITRSILVTGVSGAGKSTLADVLAKMQGLPVVRLDSCPIWKSYMRGYTLDVYARHYSQTVESEKHRRTCVEVVRSMLADFGNDMAVIEGSQLMAADDLMSSTAMFLVKPDEETVVQRRSNRDVKKRVAKGLPPYTAEELARRKLIASDLYRIHAADVKQYSQRPGVIIRK